MTEEELEAIAVGYAVAIAIASNDPAVVDEILAEIRQRRGADWPAVLTRTTKYLAEGVLEQVLSALGGRGAAMRAWLAAFLTQHMITHPSLAELGNPTEPAGSATGRN